MDPYKDKNIDSKYKFILLVSKRARQLLKGAKPKIKSKSKSLIRIAQEEIQRGAVDFNVMDESEKARKEKTGKKEEDKESKES